VFVKLFVYVYSPRRQKHTNRKKRNVADTKTEQTDIVLLILLLMDRPTDRIDEKEMSTINMHMHTDIIHQYED